MKVKVKQELDSLTDGRERFAGKSGVVTRAPIGRLGVGKNEAGEDDFGVPGELFEAAYEVDFKDGEQATFLAHELEGEGLLEHKAVVGPIFGGKDAASAGEGASVKEVPS